MIKKFLFRLIRNSLVLHMRAEGLSWAVINRVLRATGQKIVTRAEPTDNGVIIHYEDYDPVKGLKSSNHHSSKSSN